MGDTTAAAERIYAPAANVSTAVPDAADADECDDGTTDALGTHWRYAKYVEATNAKCAVCPASSVGNTAADCTAAVSSLSGNGDWTTSDKCARATTGNRGIYSTATGIGDGRPKTADASVTAGAYASGSASSGTRSSADYCPIAITYTGFTEIG